MYQIAYNWGRKRFPGWTECLKQNFYSEPKSHCDTEYSKGKYNKWRMFCCCLKSSRALRLVWALTFVQEIGC